tara:strand:- start:385 stop:582 length:198 start_codon:yes stop_codon:yes gene_type:complete
MPGKGELSYASKEQCEQDARNKGYDVKMCKNLPSNKTKRLKDAGIGGKPEMISKGAAKPSGGLGY